MYITHLAALSSLSLSSADNVHTQPPFQAPETRRFYDTDTHRNTSIDSRSLARVYVYLQRRLGAEEARVGVKTVMTAARRQ